MKRIENDRLKQELKRSCDRLLKLLEQRFGVKPTERRK